MNENKRKVRIRLEVGNDSSNTVQTVHGYVYHVEGNIFIRYEEPEKSLGKTTAVLKIKKERENLPPQLLLRRFGDTKVSQLFIPGTVQKAGYKTVHGRLEWKVQTYDLQVNVWNEPWMVEWNYDSWFEEQYVGRLHIRMTLQPEE